MNVSFSVCESCFGVPSGFVASVSWRAVQSFGFLSIFEGKADEPRDARQEAIGHRGRGIRFGLDQRWDLFPRDVLRAHVPPDRQHLFLEDPPLLEPTAFLFGGLLVHSHSAPTVPVARSSCFSVAGSASSRIRPRSWMASERASTKSTQDLCPLDMTRITRPRQRVEDLVAFRLRFERFDASDSQCLHRHDRTPGGLTVAPRPFRVSGTRKSSHPTDS